MTRINFARVLLGGLFAGAVLNIGDFLLNEPVLGEQWKSALEVYGMDTPGASAITWFVIMDFIVGTALVWLYAAIRPRFGPGVMTAIVAGLIVWFFAWLWNNGGMMAMGTFPTKLLMIMTIWGFVQLPVAAIAGAWLYKE